MLPSSSPHPSPSAATHCAHPLGVQKPYPAGLHTGLLPPHLFPSLPYNPVLGQSVYGPYGPYPLTWPLVCPPASFLPPEFNPLLYTSHLASLAPLLKPAPGSSGQLTLPPPTSPSLPSPSVNPPNSDLPPLFHKPTDFHCPAPAAHHDPSLPFAFPASSPSSASLAFPLLPPHTSYAALLPRLPPPLSDTGDLEGSPSDTCKTIPPLRGKHDLSSDASSSTSSTAEHDSDSDCDETQLASPAKKKCRSTNFHLDTSSWPSPRTSNSYRNLNAAHSMAAPTSTQKGSNDLALLSDASLFTSTAARDITQCSATSALLDASAMMAASMQASARESSGMLNSDSSWLLPSCTSHRQRQSSPYSTPAHFSAASQNSKSAMMNGSAMDTQPTQQSPQSQHVFRELNKSTDAHLNHGMGDKRRMSMIGDHVTPSTPRASSASYSLSASSPAVPTTSSSHTASVATQTNSAPMTRRSSAALSNSANMSPSLQQAQKQVQQTSQGHQGQQGQQGQQVSSKLAQHQKPVGTSYYASRQWAFQHAESDWAKYNWHVRSGGRYIMTERAHRRYFACDHPDCPAVLYEDSPVEPKTGEAIKGGEMRMTLQKEHNHKPPENGKPCNELMLRASLLLKTLSPSQVRDQLIAEAGNGIGIPSLEVIMQIVEKTRIIRKGKRGHHPHHLPTPPSYSSTSSPSPSSNHHDHDSSRSRQHSLHDRRHS